LTGPLTVPPTLADPPVENIFGRIVAGSDVEMWVAQLLAKWFGTYLAEVERQHGIPSCFYQRPLSYSMPTAPTFDKWPEDQLPALVITSTGTPNQRKDGHGTFRCRFLIGVYALCSARTARETHDMARLYCAAVRALLIQRPSLDGEASGTDWIDEDYTDLVFDDTRTLSVAAVHFGIDVDDVTTYGAGPRDVQPNADECAPWNPLVKILTHEETVIAYTPAEPFTTKED